MDFKGLHADIDKWLSKHYTPGRRGRKIQYIGIHHNAGNLSVQGCWNVSPLPGAVRRRDRTARP